MNTIRKALVIFLVAFSCGQALAMQKKIVQGLIWTERLERACKDLLEKAPSNEDRACLHEIIGEAHELHNELLHTKNNDYGYRNILPFVCDPPKGIFFSDMGVFFSEWLVNSLRHQGFRCSICPSARLSSNTLRYNDCQDYDYHWAIYNNFEEDPSR